MPAYDVILWSVPTDAANTDVRLVDTTATASGGSVAGTLSATLDAISLNATSAIAIKASASITLAGITQNLTGAVALKGVLSSTLADLTPSLTGKLPIVGIDTTTLDGITLSATGALSVAGSLSATLGALTAGSAGAVALVGALSVTLDPVAFEAAGVGSVTITCALDATLEDASLSATAELAGVQAASQDFRNVLDGAVGKYYDRRRKLLKEAKEREDAELAERLAAELRELDTPKPKFTRRSKVPVKAAEPQPVEPVSLKKRAKREKVTSEALERAKADALAEAVAKAQAEAEAQAEAIRRDDEEAAIILLLAA